MNKWIGYLYTTLIDPISKRFTLNRRNTAAYLGRAEPGPYAKINCLLSHHQINIPALSCLSILSSFSNCIFPCPLLFLLPIYALNAGYLLVTDTLSTPTITEPPSVECQDLLIPTRSNACVARIDLGFKSNPNDWAMRYKSLAYGDYALTNRNHVFCYHQLCHPFHGYSYTKLQRTRSLSNVILFELPHQSKLQVEVRVPIPNSSISFWIL